MSYIKLAALGGLSLVLASCSFSPVPTEPNIDINGAFLGRLVNQQNETALLDISLVEKDLRVTATVKSRENGRTYTLSGTRSVYNASPVTVNLTAEEGSGSVCPGGLTDKFSVSVVFYASKRGDSGNGYVNHLQCDTTSGSYLSVQEDAGNLEVVRK
ncbi:hypothetical protein ACFP81_05195 [Deinococcus lacus]|uniref:Lipoprotein n=1 Tax=Deinococcus lacus TaxID=392561 RepID=A0ABW1YE14_9DEIO